MPGPTLTESMAKMGVDPSEMPMKPMSAERCAAEGLSALARNQATYVAGRMNRILAKLMPRSVATSMMGAMIGRKFARRALAAQTSTRVLPGK
jgi:short-subunit dehydrogenase